MKNNHDSEMSESRKEDAAKIMEHISNPETAKFVFDPYRDASVEYLDPDGVTVWGDMPIDGQDSDLPATTFNPEEWVTDGVFRAEGSGKKKS